jgi:hypothetical protein
MLAIKAGDDNAAREALRQKKQCEVEAAKIERDKHEAASYAIQLNKSRKEFETKLQILKLRKGTLATQIAAARSAGGDAFGNDTSVWDKFKAAEDRIDAEAIESEVDASMRGEEGDALALEAKINAMGALPSGDGTGGDALDVLKAKMAADKAAKQKALAAAQPAAKNAAEPKKLEAGKPDAAKSDAAKPDATKADATKPDAAKPDAAKPDAAGARPAAAKPDVAKAAAAGAAKSDAPAAKAAGNAGATASTGKPEVATEGEAKTEEPPRPEVKIDMAKLEAELAAMRAAAKNEK